MNAAFGSLAHGDFAAFAQAMHPEALAEFRQMMMPVLTMAAASGDTAQGVAEVLANFPGVTTVADLPKLEPEALFAGVLRAGMAGMDSTSFAPPLVVGGVMEGDSLVHLVYRMKTATGDTTVTTVSVASLKRSPAGWRFLLTGSLEGLGGMFGRPDGSDLPEQ